MKKHTLWHRLLGIALTDVFIGRPWRVELETELALNSQRLDLLIIESSSGSSPGPVRAAAAGLDLPDGLENLAAHNLLTYKSWRTPLDGWALEELIGHYVTYRKLCSIRAAQARRAAGESLSDLPLLPAGDFRRYAIATRMPQGLLRQLPAPARQGTAWPGVYELTCGPTAIRLIVIDALDPHPRNAPWRLFASTLEDRRQSLVDYHARSAIGDLLRYQLAHVYHLEIPDMAYTVDDFKRETFTMMLRDFGPPSWEQLQELLKDQDLSELLRGLPPEERLRGLPPEERLRGLPPEERLRGLPPEERLRGLGPEELRRLEDHLKTLH